MNKINIILASHTLWSCLGCALLLYASSCERREIEPADTDFGYAYFPLAVNKYWEYQVDSIIFDPALGGTAMDTTRTYLRDEIKNAIAVDGEGGTTYYVERSERKLTTDPWELTKVYTLSRNRQQAYLTEDNLKFIKLVFPAKERKNWNGLAFFDPNRPVLVAGEQVFMFGGNVWESRIIEQADLTTFPNGQTFEDVLTVSLVADTAQYHINYRRGVEQYAADVGLIYRKLEIMDTQCNVCCPNDDNDILCELLSWPEKAEKGFISELQLIDYN